MPDRAANADLILLADRCYTLRAGSGRPAALAIRDGRILALGTARQMAALRGRATKLLDVRPGVVTPGLIDAHTHFFYWALNRRLIIDVADLPTLAATVQKLKTEARRRRLGAWIVARGFDYNRWGGTVPSAADLDRAFPRDPVLVRSRDGHTAWLNTAALQRAGISEQTADPPGGRYLRDAHGRPTGIVQEAAIALLPNPVREFAGSDEPAALKTIDAALADAFEIAWRCGIVGVHSMDDSVSLRHLQRHHAARRLGLRVVHAIQLFALPHAREVGLRSGLGDDWLRLGAVKIFSDGALSSQTAYMFDAYPGRGDYCGVANVAGAELKERVIECVRAGWPVWIHAIGDRAAHESIEAIIAARRFEATPLPHRIEHAQCVRPADIRRMARHGIAASVQPCQLLSDIDNADRHWPRARQNAYPLRGLRDAGVRLAAGSDVPIEPIDPRRSFFAAVARTDERGQPASGWFPRQRISAAEVLLAFTCGALRSVGGGLGAGMLMPGAPADLTIWGADPLTAPPEALLEIPIRGCIIGGQPHLD